MSQTVLDALARFHALAVLAEDGDDIIQTFRGRGGDLSGAPHATREWVAKLVEAQGLSPALSFPSSLALVVADQSWPTEHPGFDDVVRRLDEAVRELFAAAIEPFKDEPDASRRFLLLKELYEADRSHAGLIRDSLPRMFGVDYRRIDQWISWAASRGLIQTGRANNSTGSPLVLLTTDGVDLVEARLNELKRAAAAEKASRDRQPTDSTPRDIQRSLLPATGEAFAQRVRRIIVHNSEVSMAVKIDAGRILHAIAEFETEPGDLSRGRHNLRGEGVRQALRTQQDCDMDPARINDAVEVLDNSGYVILRRGAGSTPYRFSGVELTPSGRIEYENLIERQRASSASGAATSGAADTKKVFVIHGRDGRARKAMFDLLRSMGLQPIEWSQARSMTGKASPYIGEILQAAFSSAQAVVALFTGDDQARIRAELRQSDEPEEPLTLQARPNVLFEAGMAMGSHQDRTVFVEIGNLRPFSDIAGRHTVRLVPNRSSPDTAARQEIASRLRDAGCDVDLSGTDWHTAGDF